MRMLMGVVPLVLLAAGAAAQEPAPETPKPQPSPAVALQPAPTPPEPRHEPSLTNVRIDLTLVNQAGSGPPVRKTMTLTLADGERGSLRSLPEVAVPMMVGESVKTYTIVTLPLNVDARPNILPRAKVMLHLTLNYTSIEPAQGEEPQRPKTVVTFSGQVLLDSGRPMIVAEAADPVSDRRVTVEAKATILK
ncbi:MAG TPA: hypothetical protein VMT87_04145 [Vicinamibacteria bacterium]|nr:hypothetical protein [Vicinamibacteria bacterium]